MNPFRNPHRPRLRALAAASLAAFLLPGALLAAQPEEPIDINTASVEELTRLPRIGEVTATRIVEWREENGPFTRVEELLNVQGIGERTFERIRPHVKVDSDDRAGAAHPPGLLRESGRLREAGSGAERRGGAGSA